MILLTLSNDCIYWNQKILLEIQLMQEQHPEGIKFQDENPGGIPFKWDAPINVQSLKGYLNDLMALNQRPALPELPW